MGGASAVLSGQVDRAIRQIHQTREKYVLQAGGNGSCAAGHQL